MASAAFFTNITGRQTFPQGDTLSDPLAGILAASRLQALPAGTPPESYPARSAAKDAAPLGG